MQTVSAKKILGSLIEGCDPQSGEPLPAECVVHRSDVLRAFIAALPRSNSLRRALSGAPSYLAT